jgi:2,4-dienoyl-CoA reductase-like NADH-dependent reductase (Old Yellow Enzyme family)
LNCKEAGFDGVELHCATGCLIDQFLRDSANQRKDSYGGNVENRSKFCLEMVDEVSKIYGPGRVGIKISPVSRVNDMCDSDPFKLYSYLLT